MGTEKVEPGEFALMDGERVDLTFHLRDGVGDSEAEGTDDLMLTDIRLIHLNVNGRSRKASFVSIQDITAIDISSQRAGRLVGYLWGGLSLFVAVMAWRVWDHPIGSPVAGLAVAGMGIYLVFDRLLSPAGIRASFSAGTAVLAVSIRRPSAVGDIYGFVNRLYRIKERDGGRGSRRPRNFSPR